MTATEIVLPKKFGFKKFVDHVFSHHKRTPINNSSWATCAVGNYIRSRIGIKRKEFHSISTMDYRRLSLLITQIQEKEPQLHHMLSAGNFKYYYQLQNWLTEHGYKPHVKYGLFRKTSGKDSICWKDSPGDNGYQEHAVFDSKTDTELLRIKGWIQSMYKMHSYYIRPLTGKELRAAAKSKERVKCT